VCGICGIWGVSDAESVDSMVQAMHHRGPDDRGVFCDNQISLGMTRLAIIDTSPAGHQPLSNYDGSVWIVYNGEAYNFKSERHILESHGHTFTSSSDTEVVLRMYEHYGDDFVCRIRGMFGLAVYDRRRGPGRERLLLARDHLGIKPLLYARAGGRLVFASEMKSLLASGIVTPEIDPEGLRLLLTFGSVYQPRTIVRGVAMLPPAHRMIVERGRERIERYWSLQASHQEEFSRRPHHELVEIVAGSLEESVAMQMVSDVPLGAFLSGGIDSSLLVALMARQVSHRVKTFSVGYESEGSAFDETDEAERTARFIGTDHTKVVVTGRELRDRISNIAWGLDQPSVDGVNSYFVAKAARMAVTVAVSGNGGDELFAGYPSFAIMAADERERVTRPVEAAMRSAVSSIASRRALDRFVPMAVGAAIGRARELAGFRNRYGHTTDVFGSVGASRLISEDLRRAARAGLPLEFDLEQIDEVADGTTIQRVSALSLRGYNANQLLRDSDAVSMAHSLEVRVPFLDPSVVETALSLPDAAKLGVAALSSKHRSYRESGAKRILFDVGRQLLPPNFDAQRKRGFEMPFNRWLRGPLRDVMMDTLSARSVRNRGLLDPNEVALVAARLNQSDTYWTQPWLLMTLELWCREVADECAAGPRRANETASAAPARRSLSFQPARTGADAVVP